MWVQDAGQVVRCLPALLPAFWRAHLGRWSGSLGLLSLSWCVPSFCPFSRFVFGVLLANMALFRVFRGFLEGFPCWMWVCIACVLCVACGAFVCVRCLAVLWLEACFAFRFSLFLCVCPAFILLSLCLCVGNPLLAFLPCLCGCVVGFSFSLSDVQTKRKGAPYWCVLSWCVVGCFIWLLLCTPRTRQDSSR